MIYPNSIAVCQPYFAPYLGYFQLINSVNIFVSYDDVNFIKGGWIHRNKILINGQEKFISIPLIKQSSFKKINETEVNWDSNNFRKIFAMLEQSYAKAEFKNEVIEILDNIFESKPKTIADLALNSIIEFCRYLDINTQIKVSSIEKYEKTDDRVLNLVNICNSENKTHYINPVGGKILYDKEVFESHGIKLNFIKGMSSLSIIDVCMTRPKEEIKNELNKFELL